MKHIQLKLQSILYGIRYRVTYFHYGHAIYALMFSLTFLLLTGMIESEAENQIHLRAFFSSTLFWGIPLMAQYAQPRVRDKQKNIGDSISKQFQAIVLPNKMDDPEMLTVRRKDHESLMKRVMGLTASLQESLAHSQAQQMQAIALLEQTYKTREEDLTSKFERDKLALENRYKRVHLSQFTVAAKRQAELTTAMREEQMPRNILGQTRKDIT